MAAQRGDNGKRLRNMASLYVVHLGLIVVW